MRRPGAHRPRRGVAGRLLGAGGGAGRPALRPGPRGAREPGHRRRGAVRERRLQDTVPRGRRLDRPVPRDLRGGLVRGGPRGRGPRGRGRAAPLGPRGGRGADRGDGRARRVPGGGAGRGRLPAPPRGPDRGAGRRWARWRPSISTSTRSAWGRSRAPGRPRGPTRWRGCAAGCSPVSACRAGRGRGPSPRRGGRAGTGGSGGSCPRCPEAVYDPRGRGGSTPLAGSVAALGSDVRFRASGGGP